MDNIKVDNIGATIGEVLFRLHDRIQELVNINPDEANYLKILEQVSTEETKNLIKYARESNKGLNTSVSECWLVILVNFLLFENAHIRLLPKEKSTIKFQRRADLVKRFLEVLIKDLEEESE